MTGSAFLGKVLNRPEAFSAKLIIHRRNSAKQRGVWPLVFAWRMKSSHVPEKL